MYIHMQSFTTPLFSLPVMGYMWGLYRLFGRYCLQVGGIIRNVKELLQNTQKFALTIAFSGYIATGRDSSEVDFGR